MKIRRTLALTILLSLTVMSGCGEAKSTSSGYNPSTNLTISEVIRGANNAATDTPAASDEISGTSSYIDIDLFQIMEGHYTFMSGAGAWSTEINVHADGTFDGMYSDADMGDSDPKYENGTIYTATFTGSFEDVEKLDDFTYSVKRAPLEFEDTDFGKETILDGVRFITSDAYGLEGDGDFLVYLPGKKISGLNEEFVSWLNLWYYEFEPTYLPFVAIHNTAVDTAFVGEELENGVNELPEVSDYHKLPLAYISGCYECSNSDRQYNIYQFNSDVDYDYAGQLERDTPYATTYEITIEPYGFALTADYGPRYAMQVEKMDEAGVILKVYDSNCNYVTTLTQIRRFEEY